MGKIEVALTSAELSIPAGRRLSKEECGPPAINEWTVTRSSEALDIRKVRRRGAPDDRDYFALSSVSSYGEAEKVIVDAHLHRVHGGTQPDAARHKTGQVVRVGIIGPHVFELGR